MGKSNLTLEPSWNSHSDGYKLRKSNFNVYISNDLERACAPSYTPCGCEDRAAYRQSGKALVRGIF